MYPEEIKFADFIKSTQEKINELVDLRETYSKKRIEARKLIMLLHSECSYGEDDFHDMVQRCWEMGVGGLTYEETLSVIDTHWAAEYESRRTPVPWKDKPEDLTGMYYSIGEYDEDVPHEVEAMHHVCATTKSKEMDTNEEFTEPWEPFGDDCGHTCWLCDQKIEQESDDKA